MHPGPALLLQGTVTLRCAWQGLTCCPQTSELWAACGSRPTGSAPRSTGQAARRRAGLEPASLVHCAGWRSRWAGAPLPAAEGHAAQTAAPKHKAQRGRPGARLLAVRELAAQEPVLEHEAQREEPDRKSPLHAAHATRQRRLVRPGSRRSWTRHSTRRCPTAGGRGRFTDAPQPPGALASSWPTAGFRVQVIGLRPRTHAHPPGAELAEGGPRGDARGALIRVCRLRRAGLGAAGLPARSGSVTGWCGVGGCIPSPPPETKLPAVVVCAPVIAGLTAGQHHTPPCMQGRRL